MCIRDRYKESNIPGMQFGGKGVEYGEFVMEVVKPFIDQEYRTLADREHTAMIGSSLGGNITQFLGLEYQDQIGCLGVFSSANWLHQEAFDRYIERKNLYADQRIYIYVGTEEAVSYTHLTLAINSKEQSTVKKVTDAAKSLMADKIARQKERGIQIETLRTMKMCIRDSP